MKRMFFENKSYYDEYQSESLKKIQLGLFLILVIILITVILFTDQSLKLTYSFITISGIFVVFISSYYRKKGKHSKAVLVLITSTVVITWLPLILDSSIQKGDFIPIFYLVVPVLLSSVFVNFKLTFIISIIQLIASLATINSSSELQSQNWISYLIFYFSIVVISIITKYMYRKEIERTNLQSKKLERANEKLEIISITDDLTNLYNRRHFFEIIEKEIKRAVRMDYKITLLSIDINNFKQVNDKYGHFTGDELLKKLSAIIIRNIRDGLDSAFRFGGDEFTILLTDCSKKKALAIANRIDEEFKKSTDIASLAYGVKELDVNNPDIEKVLREADRKMYRHKKEIKRDE